jgi:hypothetical protein
MGCRGGTLEWGQCSHPPIHHQFVNAIANPKAHVVSLWNLTLSLYRKINLKTDNHVIPLQKMYFLSHYFFAISGLLTQEGLKLTRITCLIGKFRFCNGTSSSLQLDICIDISTRLLSRHLRFFYRGVYHFQL